MPLTSRLVAEIRSALGAAVTPSLTSTSLPSDVYEAYLFSQVILAARTEGALVRLEGISGPPHPFVFRTSPGHLSSRRRNYGFAVLAFPGCPELEVHAGVRIAGKSNVLHECDISVIDRREAELCRRSTLRLAPRSSKVCVAIEAKYYVAELGLHLGREFLGLVRDISARRTFFVFNRDAKSIERLLAHRNELWEHRIVPGQTVAVTRLQNALQTAFKDYKARTTP
jgi:hypothetical protein